jgi:hypothetical protein
LTLQNDHCFVQLWFNRTFLHSFNDPRPSKNKSQIKKIFGQKTNHYKITFYFLCIVIIIWWTWNRHTHFIATTASTDTLGDFKCISRNVSITFGTSPTIPWCYQSEISCKNVIDNLDINSIFIITHIIFILSKCSLFSPLNSCKMAHFGVKQQSLIHVSRKFKFF